MNMHEEKITKILKKELRDLKVDLRDSNNKREFNKVLQNILDKLKSFKYDNEEELISMVRKALLAELV